MQREIKFRGYSGNGVWTYMTLNESTWDIKVFPLKEGAILTPTEWQQFTGLKDKNGKEIYEGDIVQTGEGFEGAITYRADNSTGNAEWMVDVSFGHDQFECIYEPEIIGNIYEYKDLLK